MNLTRRQSLVLAAGAASAALPLHLRAQGFDQPKFLYGFPAGSSGDIACRRVAERVGGSAYAKNAAIVENRPGAGGRTALDGLRASAADGSVLALSPFSCMSIYPHVYKKLSYDPVADFMPVSIAAIMHHGLSVGPMVPDSVKDVKGFIAWAKANPDKANYGSPAPGSTPHFLGALLGLVGRLAQQLQDAACAPQAGLKQLALDPHHAAVAQCVPVRHVPGAGDNLQVREVFLRQINDG